MSLVLAGISIPAVNAQQVKSGDYDLEAAYLLNLGKFVRPANAPAPHSSFDICLVGHDAMGPTIDKLAANRVIDNRPVHIRRHSDVSQAKGCAIVYFNPSENDRIREDLAILPSPEALTVCDAPDFLDRGGMVQFLLIDKHVRFTVNLNAANRAHLVLSSELLRVALSVTGKPPGEQP